MLFDGLKWYKRTALIYAIGTWSLLGSCAYYTFFHSDERDTTALVVVSIRKEKMVSSHLKKISTSSNKGKPEKNGFLDIFEYAWKKKVCITFIIPKDKEGIEEDATPNVRIIKSSHMSAKITYKEDFVPYSTRFLKLFSSRADDTSGSQNDEK